MWDVFLKRVSGLGMILAPGWRDGSIPWGNIGPLCVCWQNASHVELGRRSAGSQKCQKDALLRDWGDEWCRDAEHNWAAWDPAGVPRNDCKDTAGLCRKLFYFALWHNAVQLFLFKMLCPSLPFNKTWGFELERLQWEIIKTINLRQIHLWITDSAVISADQELRKL